VSLKRVGALCWGNSVLQFMDRLLYLLLEKII
jgi:hypothetical protein